MVTGAVFGRWAASLPTGYSLRLPLAGVPTWSDRQEGPENITRGRSYARPPCQRSRFRIAGGICERLDPSLGLLDQRMLVRVADAQFGQPGLGFAQVGGEVRFLAR